MGSPNANEAAKLHMKTPQSTLLSCCSPVWVRIELICRGSSIGAPVDGSLPALSRWQSHVTSVQPSKKPPAPARTAAWSRKQLQRRGRGGRRGNDGRRARAR
jgi:hypothetical protein